MGAVLRVVRLSFMRHVDGLHCELFVALTWVFLSARIAVLLPMLSEGIVPRAPRRPKRWRLGSRARQRGAWRSSASAVV